MIPTDPVKAVWHDWEVPFVGNESIKWKGQSAFLVDANGDVFQAPAVVFDTPWYHCVSCNARLSIGANFCANCGARLDWEHTTERDKDAEAAAQEAADSKIAEAKAA